jgi:tricarballylate dehydrogenase
LLDEAVDDLKLCKIEPYTKEMYAHDLSQVSHGRNDPAMSEVLLEKSWDIMGWMKGHGVPWITTLRKYYNVEGQKGKTINVEPGAAIMVKNSGVGLMDALWAAVERTAKSKNPIEIRYDSPAHDLIIDGDTVSGVRTRRTEKYVDLYGNVILASGGFSANPAMRRQYLGEGWDLVLVRGTKYNTGVMLNRAIDAGARTVGHWGAAHASPQDYHGPLMGDISRSPHIVRPDSITSLICVC